MTLFDANGFSSRTVNTTATIVERTNQKADVIRDVPDKGIVVSSILLYGQRGEILKPNDELNAQINLKNEWNTKLKNVRIIVSIPELGLETRSSLFDFNRGSEHDEMLTLPLYNVAPGTYYVKILVENDEGSDQVKRIKYREIIVKK